MMQFYFINLVSYDIIIAISASKWRFSPCLSFFFFSVWKNNFDWYLLENKRKFHLFVLFNGWIWISSSNFLKYHSINTGLRPCKRAVRCASHGNATCLPIAIIIVFSPPFIVFFASLWMLINSIMINVYFI